MDLIAEIVFLQMDGFDLLTRPQWPFATKTSALPSLPRTTATSPSTAPRSSAARPARGQLLPASELEELLNGQVSKLDLSTEELRGKFFVVGDGERRSSRAAKDYVACGLVLDMVTGFLECLDRIAPGDVGEPGYYAATSIV